MNFSNRTPKDISVSPLAKLWSQVPDLVDLTNTNPTLLDLGHDNAKLFAIWQQADILAYQPNPVGLSKTRQAIAAYETQYKRPTSEHQVLVTASTSEAYSLLFKILGNPGDSFCMPGPSYPLFEVLTELEQVHIQSYRLDPGHSWRIDIPSLSCALERGSRAVIVVHPNNPLGALVHPDDATQVQSLCAQYQVPLIIDEVFLPYGRDGKFSPKIQLSNEVVTITLDGLSKALALPHFKVGWMVVRGPEAKTKELMARLEWAMDALLSVATPMQSLVPDLLNLAPKIQKNISNRISSNDQYLRQSLRDLPEVQVLPCAAGWYAVLRVPVIMSDEAWIIHLANHAKVLVHPGYFYDFEQEGYLVLALLLQEKKYQDAIRRMIQAMKTVISP